MFQEESLWSSDSYSMTSIMEGVGLNMFLMCVMLRRLLGSSSRGVNSMPQEEATKDSESWCEMSSSYGNGLFFT